MPHWTEQVTVGPNSPPQVQWQWQPQPQYHHQPQGHRGGIRRVARKVVKAVVIVNTLGLAAPLMKSQ